MAAQRLKWIKAGLGRKPGAGRQLARCLDVDDLTVPGRPWRRTDQRTWRTGVSAAGEPWAAAAHEAGSITVWRSFASSTDDRWLWVQIVPLARIEHGQAALAAVTRSEMRNLRAKVSVVGAATLLPTPSVPGAVLVAASEQQTRSSTDTDADSGNVLTLRFVAATTMVVMNASARGGDSAWSWPEVLTLGAAQARKLA